MMKYPRLFDIHHPEYKRIYEWVKYLISMKIILGVDADGNEMRGKLSGKQNGMSNARLRGLMDC